ncbi:MAG: hypothetical protein HYZ42_05775, partial [Bacteroidetes bacterium]|nr:hypothetical protein [Bacteroidota bacterium]
MRSIYTKTKILFVHTLFLVVIGGCSRSYVATIKINGKVSAQKYTKIEETVNSLKNENGVKFKGYKIERSDLSMKKDYKPSYRLIYTKDEILTKGEFGAIDSVELKN